LKDCSNCKNEHTYICMQCLVIGGNQTYYWWEEKLEDNTVNNEG